MLAGREQSIAEKVAVAARGLYSQARYRLIQRTRPRANAWFGRISKPAQREGTPGTILCEALWDHPHHYLRVAMLRRALAPRHGSRLIGVVLEGEREPAVESLKALGVKEPIIVPRSAPDRYLEQAADILRDVESPRDLLNIELPHAYPAYRFYDAHLKQYLLGTIDRVDDRLRGHLGLALFYLDFYADLLDRNEVSAVVQSHPTTVRFSTLMHAALSRDIPVFQANYINEHINLLHFTGSQDLGCPPFVRPTTADRDGLDAERRERLIECGRLYLTQIRQGQASQFSNFDVYRGDHQTRQALAARIGCAADRHNVVLFANCWPDFPNTFGPTYFTDYVDWFRITIEVVRQRRDVNWIIKPHPAEFRYGSNCTLAQLLDDAKVENLLPWPKEVSSTSIVDFADAVITTRGTAGLEYPALGVATLAARDSNYTDWGFVPFCRTRNEYGGHLRSIETLPKPTPRQQEDALIYIALTLTSPANTRGDYTYPRGIYSYNLWPGLPRFVRRNLTGIDREIRMIGRWVGSGTFSYNVYKSLHAELWDQV